MIFQRSMYNHVNNHLIETKEGWPSNKKMVKNTHLAWYFIFFKNYCTVKKTEMGNVQLRLTN